MNAMEARSLMVQMTASWSQRELTKPEREIWLETLEAIPYGPARLAVSDLRKALDWMPTHHQFAEAVDSATKRIASSGNRALPAGDRKPWECGLCGNGGWMECATISGEPAVTRCRCDKGRVSTEHPNGCTCMACHYGPEDAARIRAGWSFRSEKPHPLSAVGADRELSSQTESST